MPKLVRPLSDAEIKKAKPKDKQYKLSDGAGMSLMIFPNGTKSWRLDYTFNKKRGSVSLGAYPDVSLKEAREKREATKRNIKDGINPSSKIIDQKKQIEALRDNTFKDVALEYFEIREDLSEGYIKDSIQKLTSDIFPYVKNMSMDDIEPLTMLKHLQRIDNRGSNVSAKKTFSIVERVYKYAVTIGKAKRNIMNDLDKQIAFRTVEKKNFAHTTDEGELKRILLATEKYEGDYSTKMALKVLPYVFVRPANIRFMKWANIDLKSKIWTISGEEMKTKKDLIVPLSDSVIDLLNEMKDYSFGVSEFVFPSRISNLKSLSENTLNFGLKRMGFNVTSHGFRHTASTFLHENIRVHKIPSDVIEIQLAHKVGGSVHQVYNKALYLDERIELMQWWSDYLDALKRSKTI